MPNTVMSDAEFLGHALAGARERWNASPGLQGQFARVEDFVAHYAAIASGNTEAARPGFVKEWWASPSLQAEFPTAESYAGFRLAEMRGTVRTYRSSVQSAR